MKWVVLAVAATLALAGVAQAVPPTLTYSCTKAPVDCDGWFRVPVVLEWGYDDTIVDVSGGNCSKQTFTSNTQSTKVYCEVQDEMSGDITGRTVTIRVDRTAPSITGPGLGRPPDRNDWFNHPVAFQFTGQDATSGIDSCTGGTYGGADGAGVSISGSCRDVAGNEELFVRSKIRDGRLFIDGPHESTEVEMGDQLIFRRSAEIGYWLGEEYWGRGIVTEAVKVFTEWAFANFDLSRIYAGVFEWNPASARVMEKAGFEFEGRMKKAVTKEGRTGDELIYAITS